jgi:hypothetical protein
VSEDRLIQKFVAQAAVKRLYEGILLRLSLVDIVPGDGVLIGPFRNCPADELRPVFVENAAGRSVDPHQRVQLTGNTRARDAGIRYQV